LNERCRPAPLRNRGQGGRGGKNGQTVRGRHETTAADDEVAIAVAIRRSAKIRRVNSHGKIVKMFGVNEVRIGMMAAEVGQRSAVDDGTRRGAQRGF